MREISLTYFLSRKCFKIFLKVYNEDEYFYEKQNQYIMQGCISTCSSNTKDCLAERRQSVRETSSLLYNRMTDNIEYGREILKFNGEKKQGKERNK